MKSTQTDCKTNERCKYKKKKELFNHYIGRWLYVCRTYIYFLFVVMGMGIQKRTEEK